MNWNEESIKWLSHEEIAQLLASIDSIRDKVIFTLAYKHGLRVGEVALIQDGDYQKGQLKIRREKKGLTRVHDLDQEQEILLNKWLENRGKLGDETPLFLSRQGKAISKRQLDTLMKSYGAKAKLPKDRRHFHVLRHSCAVHMIELDINPVKIKDWLGHRNINSTMVYAAVSPKAQSDTAKIWYRKEKEEKPKHKINWKKDKISR